MGKTSQSYGASPAIWGHIMLQCTCHLTQINVPQLNPARQAGSVLNLPILEGRKAELTLVVSYIPVRYTSSYTVTHPSSNHLIPTRSRFERTTSWSWVRRPKPYTTKPKCTNSSSNNINSEQQCLWRSHHSISHCESSSKPNRWA